MKKLAIAVSGVCLCGVLIYATIFGHNKQEDTNSFYQFFYNDSSEVNDKTTLNDSDTLNQGQGSTEESIASIHAPLDLVADSITVFINKEYGLPKDYVPEDLEIPNIYFDFSYYDEKKLLRTVAARAIEELCEAAEAEGLSISGVSGYRSYNRQKSIYENNIRTRGYAYTSKYSAQPGYSEHQSGLSIDLSTPSLNNTLQTKFAETPEGIWLAKNCYKFGFIIRYPEGKEHITGYSYEPWHVRYVGIELATYLTENQLTLEEYYNYTPSDTNQDFSYDSLVDEDSQAPDPTTKPTKKPSKTPTPTATVEPTMTPEPTTTTKPTKTPEATTSSKPTKTPEATATTKPTTSPEPTMTPTVAPTQTVAPTPTVTPVPTATPSSTGLDESQESNDEN